MAAALDTGICWGCAVFDRRGELCLACKDGPASICGRLVIMAVTGVHVETELGEVHQEGTVPIWPLQPIFDRFDRTVFPLLHYLDPYGDLILNRHQVQDLLSELEELQIMARSDEQRRAVAEIERLAHVVLSDHHLYLRFLGD